MNKKTNTVILWLIAIGLLLGMIITFTPNLGFGGGGVTTAQGDVVLRVNGEPVTDLEINQLRNSNPLYYAVTEGEVGDDLQLLALDAVITQELLRQAAASQRVSNSEVKAAVNAFREERGVAGGRNDSNYIQLLASSGFDDASFRAYMRDQLRQQKWEAGIVGEATVTDEEVETFYEAFRNDYRTDERIVARAIAVTDPELASELRTRVLTGESFAKLATEHSVERADRAGAVGASSGSTEPQPVGRAALPSAVSSAAFQLRAPGLTNVISASGQYWLVQVEEYLAPQVKPFEEVAEEVREDAITSLQVGLISRELDERLAAADIEVVDDSEFRYDNPPVATVGGKEIRAADLARATYGNAEVQQFLDPSLSFLITDMLKPQILDQLVDQAAAFTGAAELDGRFFGTEAQVARQALNWVTRDISLDDADLEAYYEENIDRYTEEAHAQAVSFEFDDFESAENFREAVLAGTTPTDAAIEAGVEATDLGTVTPGSEETAIDAALFGTDAFERIDASDREISDVLFIRASADAEDGEDDPAADADEIIGTDTEETAAADSTALEEAAAEAAAEVLDGEDTERADEELSADPLEADDDGEEAAARDRYVVLVATRSPERTRPLEEVADLVRDAALAEARADAQTEWLDEARAGLEVETLLPEPAADQFGDIDFSPEEPLGDIEFDTDDAIEAVEDAEGADDAPATEGE